MGCPNNPHKNGNMFENSIFYLLRDDNNNYNNSFKNK